MNLWHVDNPEPAIRPGQLHPGFDDRRAGAAHVLRHAGGGLEMCYWGTDDRAMHSILSATAPAGQPHSWQPRGTPLLGPQPGNPFNNVGPSFPFLLPLTPERQLLYFCAWGRPTGTGKLPNTTGVAVSDDAGATWRYHDKSPLLPLDRDYDREGTGSVWVLADGGRFRMYYTAIAAYGPKPAGVVSGHGDTIPHIGIAYAESADGLHWEKPFSDWVVKPRGFAVEPYEYICSKPCVLKTEDCYLMWVCTFGYAYRVHRLRSSDGVNWEWLPRQGPDGELGHGAPGAFDDHQRTYPCMLDDGGVRRCWFTGNGFGATGMGYAEARSGFPEL